MTAETHELESVSSFGKDDDPSFVPNYLNKKSRTGSLIQKAKYAVASRVSPADNPQGVQDATPLRQAQDRLLQQITGGSIVSGVRKTCWDWYLTYLDARITEIWPTFAAKALQGAGSDANMVSMKARADLYDILVRIARFIEERSTDDDDDGECTLIDMVSELKSERFIKDDTDNLGVQVVFHCVGWLTALFDPAPVQSNTHLCLRKIDRGFRRRRLVRKTVIRHFCVTIADGNRPLPQLLGRFGSLLPRPECVRRIDAAGGLESGSECLIASYISFHSLQQVLGIELEWVDVLNQHLEFDQSKGVLRVFRLPSMCRLMYRDVGGTLLNELFHENEEEYDERPRSPHSQVTDIQDFLAEVLLSYRLIFGRKKWSRKRIGRYLEEEKDAWQKECRYDPLLEILCTQSEDSSAVKELYTDLEAKKFDDYISVDEFPFLARRLFDLQRFSMAQNPHGWRRLWADRRNITSWFTIWAVVIIGGATLVFQVLQVIFQIYQPLLNSGGGGGGGGGS